MNDRVDLQRLLSDAQPLAPAQGVATVTEVLGRQVSARCAGVDVPMRLAASCLLVPAAGDRVCWCADPDDRQAGRWVTAVLERAHDAPATLQLPDDATLGHGAGRLRIAAKDLLLESEALQIRAQHASLLFDSAEAIGACWQGIVSALRWTGTSIGAVVDRVTLVAKTHQRITEGSDTVQAGTLDLRARGLATVHAEHVLVEGERLVKSRAPQIHMG
jgi:hypothetical protein